MQIFDSFNFRQFLKSPIYTQEHIWGQEQHFVVSEKALLDYENILKDTFYHHHSSFDYFDEIDQLGFSLCARALRERNFGSPNDHKTQMANLGEVFGIEFSRAFLGFSTTDVFPKRFNSNVDQSMKGTDIIGLRADNETPELLIGEAKSIKQYNTGSVKEAYNHLAKLHQKEATWLLRLYKEIANARDDKALESNLDRHMAKNVQRHYLIMLITQSEHKTPFENIDTIYRDKPIPSLLAVHVRISNLLDVLPDGNKSWLSDVFEL